MGKKEADVSRTLIKGGTVVTASETVRCDVLIEGEKVVALLGGDAPEPTVDRVIDATDRLIFPGSVDAHTHMEIPFGAAISKDTFETGTQAAAWGGTTTIIDFPIQMKGESLMGSFEDTMAKAAGSSAIDFGFHQIVGDVNEQSLADLDLVLEEGVTSYKLFTAYPGVYYSTDAEVAKVMQWASGNGSTILMHAENGSAIDLLREQAIARGDTAPYAHAATRPAALEGEAAHRVILLAEMAGAPVYIVHISAKQVVAEIAAARARGTNAFGETCPQYLYLELAMLDQGFEGAKFVCSPPLRDPAEGHQAALWQGLSNGDLQVIATDHCPFDFEGQKTLGRDDFTQIPNGLPVVEHRFPLMLHAALAEQRFSLNRMVEISAAAPAKMFGLYPQKGTIAVGCDADIAIVDPAATSVISAETHHMNVDYSCFEGMELTGKVETVFSRGQLIVSDDRFVGSKSHGRYLRRGLNQLLF
ncbi:MAG: dihydropyrimidinase [bacterium]|nr:dihydropyrimidinase [bacterium]